MSNVAGSLAMAVSALSLILLFVGMATFIALVKGCLVMRRQTRAGARDIGAILLKSPLVPSVSMIAAPPDNSRAARDYIRLLVGLAFGRHEVVVVLDGPSPEELKHWSQEFHLVRTARAGEGALATARVRGVYHSQDPISMVLVDKERGGESDAFNAGVNAASSPVIGLLDPESQFSPEVLLRMIRPMLEKPEETIAVCGIAPPPERTGLAGRIGTIEFLRIWLARCTAFSGWNMLLPVPGASMLARRDAVIAVGGFRAGPFELAMQLHKAARRKGTPYRVAFVPDLACHSAAPASLSQVRHLMLRDQREIARGLRGHLGTRAGIALVTVRLVRPLLETVAYLLAAAALALGWADLSLVGLLLLSTAGFGIVISMAAVVLRELAVPQPSDPSQLAGLFFSSIPENLGYRQLRNIWMVAGFFQRGSKGSVSRNPAL